MEAIIFDFGGVLCFHPTDRQVNELAALCGVPRKDFLHAYWSFRVPYDRGDYDGAGYWAAIGEALGREYSNDQIQDFIAHDVAFWTSLDQRMLKWIREMRVAGIKTGLISNFMFLHRDQPEGDAELDAGRRPGRRRGLRHCRDRCHGTTPA